MKKQYGLDEFIDLLTQARGHLQRADAAESRLQVQREESARLDAEIHGKQSQLVSIEAMYASKRADAEAKFKAFQENLAETMAKQQEEQSAVYQDQKNTYQAALRKLQAEVERLTQEASRLKTEVPQLQLAYDALAAKLARVKEEARALVQ